MTRPAVPRLAERTLTRRAHDPDRPVPLTLTPKGHAALRESPQPARPPVVCLCGSTRFVAEFNRQRKNLTEDGRIVLSIEIVTTQTPGTDPQHASPALKARLDELHLRKIDLADYVLVINVGGYTGESTRSEIAYARDCGKPVTYLEPPAGTDPGGWACRRCGDAWHGTAPDDPLCPGGCQAAA